MTGFRWTPRTNRRRELRLGGSHPVRPPVVGSDRAPQFDDIDAEHPGKGRHGSRRRGSDATLPQVEQMPWRDASSLGDGSDSEAGAVE